MDNSKQFQAETQEKSLAEVLKAKGLASSLAEAEDMARNIKDTSTKIDTRNSEHEEDKKTGGGEYMRDTVEEMLKQFSGQLGNELSSLNERMNTVESQMEKVITQLNLITNAMNSYFNSNTGNMRPQPKESEPLTEQQTAQQTQFSYTEAPQQTKQAAPRGMQQQQPAQQSSSSNSSESSNGGNSNESYDKSKYDITKYFYSGPKN